VHALETKNIEYQIVITGHVLLQIRYFKVWFWHCCWFKNGMGFLQLYVEVSELDFRLKALFCCQIDFDDGFSHVTYRVMLVELPITAHSIYSAPCLFEGMNLWLDIAPFTLLIFSCVVAIVFHLLLVGWNRRMT
jgi:hypothetical protein